MFNTIFAEAKLGHHTDCLERWKKLFPEEEHIKQLIEQFKKTTVDSEQISQLTPEVIEQWLSCLVEACWKARIATGPGDISLSEIYEQKTDWWTEYDQVETAKEMMLGLKRANGQPRYLVPALRLAYETFMMKKKKYRRKGWEETLSKYFLDSVVERADVFNFFAAHHQE